MNDENLIPFDRRTESEQREIRSQGGKASGVSRNFIGAFKQYIKDNPETMEKVIDSVVSQAKSGNVKAAEFLVDLNGESVQRENLRLKAKELKMKEKALQNNQPEASKEEPLLYKALGSDED